MVLKNGQKPKEGRKDIQFSTLRAQTAIWRIQDLPWLIPGFIRKSLAVVLGL